MKYVRATDVNGAAWGAAVSIDVTGNVGLYTSLVVVNGNPAISYYDNTNFDLKYVRATDANGSTWGTPAIIDATTSVGLYTSMEIVNGNPAIAYYYLSNGDMKYVRATDVSGSTWGAPVTLDVTGNVGQYTCLKLVNGNPAISYYDATNLDLKYVRATDVSGTTWGTPATLDALNTTGQYGSMVSNGTSVAVAYYNVTESLPYILPSTTFATLPITLTNVKAYQKNSGVQVEWTAEQQQDVEKYEIERSANGRDFAAIGALPAADIYNRHTYQFFDPSPLGGSNWYRIKTLSVGAAPKYSAIMRMNSNKASGYEATIYPNPVKNQLSATVYAVKTQLATMRIITADGRMVQQQLINLQPGSNSTAVDVKYLAEGVYYLEVSGEGFKATKQFIKQ